MSDSVVLIDSGGANIASLRFALQRLGVDAALTTDADRIRAARRVILPGVGAAADAMERLAAYSYLARLLDQCETASADAEESDR